MVAKRKPKHEVEATDREEVERVMHALVKSGFASWSGKRPTGSKNPVEVTPGPPVSDYVIQDRG
jgi:hypothetical protein